MKTKRLLSIILSVALIGLSLAGCAPSVKSNTGTTPAPTSAGTSAATPTTPAAPSLEDIIPDKTTELIVYSQLANYSGEQIGWFAQIMKEKFNVVLNIIPTGEGVFATRGIRSGLYYSVWK